MDGYVSLSVEKASISEKKMPFFFAGKHKCVCSLTTGQDSN